MEWAIDYNGNHIRAGDRDSEKAFLRCPVCKARVYHRNGYSRRAHFAHFSGNSNQECELYYPGMGISTFGNKGTINSETYSISESLNLGSPALIWRDGEQIPISMLLRLPSLPREYPWALCINSQLGHRKLSGEQLEKTTFAPVALQIPPTNIEISPRDPTIEARLKEVIGNFKHEGNFFRAHHGGGTLIASNAPLELGETYYLVSQRGLSLVQPNALEILQTRADRNWTVYKLRLRDNPESRKQDITDLRNYFSRDISLPRPKVDLLWPPPSRIDPDGAYVYSTSTKQVIIRSNTSSPYGASTTSTLDATPLGRNLYSISFGSLDEEVSIGVRGGTHQHLRFEDVDLAKPDGVELRSANLIAGLHTVDAVKVVNCKEGLVVKVPTERLWRNARVNQLPLRSLPTHRVYEISDSIKELDFGSFGRVSVSLPAIEDGLDALWYKKFERLIVAMAGPLAWAQLSRVSSRGQLISWAARNRAHPILPLILSAFSVEVDRGLSRSK
ncbi:hypothetical protein ACSC9U_26555 [Pseudomonas solani]|uniref:competence protein CoiA family protein n=1 Tax=Pseudomonas solani TaxID=2731552 RepID=UPI003F4AF282